MYIVKRENNIRLILIIKRVIDSNTNSITKIGIYKIQLKCLLFWVTIKEFEEDNYNDAVECYKYCTNPYKLK